MNNLAPIVVFAYNRPDHLRQTLEALAKNDLASESVLYIYCDGAKKNASVDCKVRISEVRCLAKQQSWAKKTYVIESPYNRGLADSIIGGVTEIVNKYGRVIVLEDDMITSKGFLKYMNDALEIYKDEEKVMHITGYMFPIKKRLPETFFYEVPHCWSWATWQRAWKYFSNDIDSLYNYWKNDWNTFNHWGEADLQRQLEANYKGTLYTWYVKWHAVVLKMGGLTLWPRKALVYNIGCDGTGENCSNWHGLDTPSRAEYINVEHLDRIAESHRAYRLIKDFNYGHWYNRRRRTAFLKYLKNLILPK